MKKQIVSLTIAFAMASILFMSCKKDEDNKPQQSGESTFEDPRDGKIYKTIRIGNQTWFVENLRFTGPVEVGYINDPYGKVDSTKKYGPLYTWEAANLACPNGWHLPSDEEWRLLEHNLEMSNSDTAMVGYSQLRGVDQKLGTRMQVGGNIGFNFVIMSTEREQEVWTSSRFSATKSYIRNFTRNDFSIYRTSTEPGTALCVRCLKD
ncbi:FISUMP domain-containing protein [Sporocytophaga myxococcoides]|uniref:FISUMP domain-containing protein n=1 Tax=Sporocytophaga myxococcoides TaxID=153721 RepID=UPI00048B8741|nr:FISUMP domain-containing protein [Sporocytophaga myxococcoides]